MRLGHMKNIEKLLFLMPILVPKCFENYENSGMIVYTAIHTIIWLKLKITIKMLFNCSLKLKGRRVL